MDLNLNLLIRLRLRLLRVRQSTISKSKKAQASKQAEASSHTSKRRQQALRAQGTRLGGGSATSCRTTGLWCAYFYSPSGTASCTPADARVDTRELSSQPRTGAGRSERGEVTMDEGAASSGETSGGTAEPGAADGPEAQAPGVVLVAPANVQHSSTGRPSAGDTADADEQTAEHGGL